MVRKTKCALMMILIIIFTKITVNAAIKETYKFSIDGSSYSMDLPKDWTFKSSSDKNNNLEFYKGDILTGGFIQEVKEIDLKDYKYVEDINTALGKAKIYQLETFSNEDKNIIYGLIKSEKSQCAMYVYSDEKDVRKNIFILKMLLININNNS